MRIPSEVNLVRITGLGITVAAPSGFRRVGQLPGDQQKYFVRKGYRIQRCPGAHGYAEGCAQCLPFHGAVAVLQEAS